MQIKNYRAWFKSELHLKEIGDIFKQLHLVTDYFYDYENVYEWFEADALNTNVKLNISRKHNDGINVENENISILVIYENEEPEDSLIDKVSKLISKELNLTIYTGEIEYLGGDDYNHIPKSSFSK